MIGWTIPLRNQDGYHDDQEDSFVMIGKSEEQMRKWSEKVLELANNERKIQEDMRAARMKAGRLSNSERQYYQHSSFGPPTPATEHPPVSPFNMPPLPNGSTTPYYSEDEDPEGLRSGRTTPSIQGYHPYAYSGQPSTGRRVQSQQSVTSVLPTELRARAMTEDQYGPSMTQWRTQQPTAPPLPRLTSAMSGMSVASELSFGSGPGSTGIRTGMVRQMSSTRLPRATEVDEGEGNPMDTRESYGRYGSLRGMMRAPSHAMPSMPHPPPLRNRSASSPNVYQQPTVTGAVSLPYTAGPNGTWTTSPLASTLQMSTHPYVQSTPVPGFGPSSSTTLVGGTAYFNKRMSNEKRSSGESHHSTTTTDTSDQTSPATPYGSGNGDVRGPLRQNSGDNVSGSVLVKLRFGNVGNSYSLIRSTC